MPISIIENLKYIFYIFVVLIFCLAPTYIGSLIGKHTKKQIEIDRGLTLITEQKEIIKESEANIQAGKKFIQNNTKIERKTELLKQTIIEQNVINLDVLIDKINCRIENFGTEILCD